MAKRPIKPGGPVAWVVTFHPKDKAAESFWVDAATPEEARKRACRVSGHAGCNITDVEQVTSNPPRLRGRPQD